jgi:hypothetical protein
MHHYIWSLFVFDRFLTSPTMAVLVHTVTMLTAATAAAILSLLNHHQHVVTAYYLPGVNPHNYEKGEVYVDSNMVCVAESNWFRTIKVLLF